MTNSNTNLLIKTWVGPLLALTYVVTGKLGLMLALPPGYVSGVFPAAGIALSAAYLWGRGTYPWIFLGSLTLNLWAGSFVLTTSSVAVALCIALASTLQAGIGSALLHRAIGCDAPLDTGTQTSRYLLISPLACLVSATLSVASLYVWEVLNAAKLVEAWSTWWIGDTLGVMALFPLMQALFGKPASAWQKRRAVIAITTILSLTLVVMAFIRSSEIETAKLTQSFTSEAGRIAGHIQEALDDQADVVNQLEIYISQASSHVDRREFSAYVQPILWRFPMVQAIEWAPQVTQSRRASFEMRQREAFPGFNIQERSASGAMVSAAERSVYYPITYLEPRLGNEQAFGFDLISTPDREAAVLETLRTGKPVATPPIRLVQENGSQAGMLLLKRADTSPPGVVLTVLRMGDFISKLVPQDNRIHLTMVDVQLGEFIYGAPSNRPALTKFVRDLEVGGRKFRLQITPSEAYIESQHSLHSWGMLVVGTLGAGLLIAIVVLTTGTTFRVRRLVEERTSDLIRANKKLTETMTAMDMLGFGITWVDARTGRYIYSNSYISKFLGYSAEELHKLSVADIDPSFTNEKYVAISEQIIKQGYSKFETTQRTKSGPEIPIDMSIYYQPHEGNTPPYFISFQTDIRQRKAIEKALLEAKDAAEIANRAKSLFLANMSHEIRTPMNGVIGMTDVLLNTSLSDEQRQMADVIRDSAQAQLAILNDILDFSKIEADKLDLSLEPFSLSDVVEKTCATLTGQARQNAVRLDHDLDSAIPEVLEGDSLRVRQILSNLTSNAIKFSSGLERSGQVVVNARLESKVETQVWVELSICDNGIGMDEATLERVFNPFTQADASTTRKYGGSGLGLVISTRLTEAMGGTIRAKSTLGVGSTFTVRLPFRYTKQAQTPEAAETSNLLLAQTKVPGREEAMRQDGRLILVAEDNEINQSVIRHQLSTLGYQCDIANDGQEAFEMWLKGIYGLVLTDIHMPDMDGYQLAKVIRAEEENRGVDRMPILALSANVLNGESERCQSAGMDGYMAKPISLSQLKEQLQQWLPGHQPAMTNETPSARIHAEDAGGLPVFDPGMLSGIVGDNLVTHRRLIKKYLINSQDQAEHLRAALVAKKCTDVAQIAHGLKSNARAVGAMRLGDLCEKLEHAGKANDLVVLESLLTEFNTTIAMAHDAIEAYYTQG